MPASVTLSAPVSTTITVRMRTLAQVPGTVLVLGAATAASLVFTGQIYLLGVAFGRDMTWGQAAYWAFGDWFEWALLSPAIFWLCRRCSGDRISWPRWLSWMLAGALFFSAVHSAMCAGAAVLQGVVVGPDIAFRDSFRQMIAGRTPFNLVAFGLIVCAWHVWRHYRGMCEREAQLVDLRGRLAEAQLLALRMQLNPHFLYNTLNAISSLMLTDVPTANRMISRLGELLRVALDTDAQAEIPLARELSFLESYLEIEQIRFGDRLRVHIDPAADTLDAAVPNFLLQPLVENAIRHAIELREANGEINLCTRRENGWVLLQVQDNGPAADRREHDATPARERIGLGNTRQRLEKLYGTRHQFALSHNPAGGITASITIPFRAARVPG